MGESETKTVGVDTSGGRIQIRWDEIAEATPQGQFVFFVEYLTATKIFDEWVETCPITYTSGNAPLKRDVLGTLLLSILAGNSRYAHITGLRGDRIAAQALGMERIRSADGVRRGLSRMDGGQSAAWLTPHLFRSVAPALSTSWILDVDATVKPLYGHQEGAKRSYNPHKPGRPSHVLHTYWVANLRLVLDVVLKAGDEHTSKHSAEGLQQLLHTMTPAQRPAFVRGDCGYGNQPMMEICESMQQPYLFRLRQTSNVKRLLEQLAGRQDWTKATALDQGYQAIESPLQLSGWTHARRVIVLRRRVETGVTPEVRALPAQLTLPHISVELVDGVLWEHTVLVTNSSHELTAMGQLYRDRCDCENGFDELKNQWGWGGFTTHDLARNQTMARSIALIHNWWSWYALAAQPDIRMEAQTSRPLLLAGIGRMLRHAGQTILCLTPMHASVGVIKSMIHNISDALQAVKRAAQQLRHTDPWHTFVDYVRDKILRAKHRQPPCFPLPK